jgi:hypothetical protein
MDQKAEPGSDSASLELEDDLAFERREWRIQRVAWALLGLVVLAGLLGFLGPGPLTRSVISPQDRAISLEYYRFERSHRMSELRISVAASAGESDRIRLWIRRAYADEMRVQAVLPPADRVDVDADRVLFSFARASPTREARILLKIEPQSTGPEQGEIGLDGGSALAFTQFVYP